MSFSAELKTELCKLRSPECCRKAELFAMAVFGLIFSGEKIEILTQSADTAQNFAYLAKKVYSARADITSSNGARPTFKAVISGADAEKIFADLPKIEVTEDCCKNSFLRGAFLACGQISDPEKGFRIDFRIKNREFMPLLVNILTERELPFSVSKRDKYDLIYLKKSEAVEDLITMLGAGNITLSVMQAKMLNELRGDTNRRANIEISNLSKIVESSIKQRKAIEKIIKREKFESLPEDLQEVALLRTGNPEASLGELCKLCSFSVTRSGLNHKLQKLIEIAERIK